MILSLYNGDIVIGHKSVGDKYRHITKNEYDKIGLGCEIDIETLDIIETDEYTNNVLSQKAIACKEKILSCYSYTDQQNITGDAIVSGDNTELEKMRVFVNAMLDELHTNGKDADFSEINP